MIIAVDFDGTLALGNYSHISLLRPNIPLINRLSKLDTSVEVIIVTARGSKAGLPIAERERRYKRLIFNWLGKYKVRYGRISFEKEYANLYIDDMTIGPFEPFNMEMSEFTGNKIVFTENTVIKCAESALFEFEWYKKARDFGFIVPEVLFCNDESIILSRVYDYGKPTAKDFISLIYRFSEIYETYSDFGTYIRNLPADVKNATKKVKDVVRGIDDHRHEATFFHGDLSTTNVLCTPAGQVLIDPNSKYIFGSYLTDAGKAAFSLIAYESDFEGAKEIADRFGAQVWPFAVCEGLRVCKYAPGYIDYVNNIADII